MNFVGKGLCRMLLISSKKALLFLSQRQFCNMEKVSLADQALLIHPASLLDDLGTKIIRKEIRFFSR